MPTSRNGAGAPSLTYMKTRGDRKSPKGRTLYCHTRLSNAGRSYEESRHESKCPSGQPLQTKLGAKKGQIRDSQIQDWPKATAFLGYDEEGAVNPCLISAGGAGSIASFTRRTTISSHKTIASQTATVVLGVLLSLGGRLAN